MKLNQIRKSFLEFFEQNGHSVLPSSSLIPSHDPSLLFTNSGMVQFKNYFTKAETPTFSRATTAQKCIRAGGKHNDLENVGYTARHHTFFEMLGNFSFGDYFKEEAIEFAWKYLTQVLQLDRSKLYITVYHSDDEAYNIWHKLTGFSSNKIIRIASSDNFWSMGDSGPCGPCSEIFFDHGDRYQGGLPGAPDEGGDRYIEIWNLVFMQYEQILNGDRIPLPEPAIDTGMGLERIAAVMQGVNDNYDTDLFLALRQASLALSGGGAVVSHKVIADHLRASCFLIADGAMPSNDGRGYVLRRIMRRAMRHIHKLGVSDGMLYKLVPILVREMSEAYPELTRAEAAITSIIKVEEEKFGETLDRGLKILGKESEALSSGAKLSGKVAFTLYDTYGFPLDLTRDVLRERNIEVDEASFEQAMQEQKQRAKSYWSGSGDTVEQQVWHQLHKDHGATDFIGYEKDEATAKIIAIVVDGNIVEAVSCDSAIIIVDHTPFYAESGGQVGDIGKINISDVVDVRKYSNDVFGHHVLVRELLRVGDDVKLMIDSGNRAKLRANHSATHLMHKALRQVLGDHVAQKGSIVTAEKLRLDFAHNTPLSIEQLLQVEEEVNQAIMSNFYAKTEVMTSPEAIASGAIALFGEKYGDKVRVVSIGNAIELCGGTHVKQSGDIGLFKITSEQSIASGVRRIEAVTGLAALQLVSAKQQNLIALSSLLKCSEAELVEKISVMRTALKDAERKLIMLQAQNETAGAEVMQLKNMIFVSKIAFKISNEDAKALLEALKKKHLDSVICLINESGATASVLCSVNGKASEYVKANELLQKFSHDLGGKGGGANNLAQFGQCRTDAITNFLSQIKQFLQQI